MELLAKIKLSKKQVQTLAARYNALVDGMEIPAGEHGDLLFEHACELFNKLLDLTNNDQAKYTLKLKGSAALAFLQLWKIVPVLANSHEQVIIANIIQEIDKTNVHAKILSNVPPNI